MVIAILALAAMSTTHPSTGLVGDPTPTAENAGYLPIIASEPTPTPGCVPPPEIPSGDPANEAAIQGGINHQRELNHLYPFVQAPELVQSARRHSLDMATNDFTGHTGSDGSTHWERMDDACYEANYSGEIIGWGFGGDPASMINWWMNSPPHRALILSTVLQDFGAGYIRDVDSRWGHYWTVNFGRRAAGQATNIEALYRCIYTIEGAFGGSSLMLLSAEPCKDSID